MAKEGFGLEITELRLGLPGGGFGRARVAGKNEKKRVFSEIEKGDHHDDQNEAKSLSGGVLKNQVVGWPPVCSYRRKNSFSGDQESTKMYVKVSMDGAPFLRKIDLSAYKGYYDLQMNLEKLFGYFGIGEALNAADSSECVPIYEDKDGDWMLVGDVPWTMFIESCKRLRIKKRTEAKGTGLHTKKHLSREPLKMDDLELI
ncbi:hypothetical protein ACH5RR_024537 [Cinchona calisaya]|uniref:Auxin-responsive protein n=1 Tax=Cinchona calisaya TaxID=153742 RepID=A0ABD2YWY9_9GENT